MPGIEPSTSCVRDGVISYLVNHEGTSLAKSGNLRVMLHACTRLFPVGKIYVMISLNLHWGSLKSKSLRQCSLREAVS